MNKCSYVNINIAPIHLIVNRYYEKILYLFIQNSVNDKKVTAVRRLPLLKFNLVYFTVTLHCAVLPL